MEKIRNQVTPMPTEDEKPKSNELIINEYLFSDEDSLEQKIINCAEIKAVIIRFMEQARRQQDKKWQEQIGEFKKSALNHPLLTEENKKWIDLTMKDFEHQLRFYKMIE